MKIFITRDEAACILDALERYEENVEKCASQTTGTPNDIINERLAMAKKLKYYIEEEKGKQK